MKYPFKEISLVIFICDGILYSRLCSILWPVATFVPLPQSTDSVITAESHLIGCACCSTWQTPQPFHCTAAILPHKINSRSHYKDFRFDLSRCYHSSVILLFYRSSKNKKLISSNRPFKNNIVRYFVYFCSGSKNSYCYKIAIHCIETKTRREIQTVKCSSFVGTLGMVLNQSN